MTQPEKNNIFICAAGHSGSTLLDLILGSHSSITSLGEITQLPKNIALNTICTCGTPVRNCKYWAQVLRKLENRLSIDITNNPYALDLGFIDARVVIDRRKQTQSYELCRKLVMGATYISWRYHVPIPTIISSIYDRTIKNNLALYDVVRDVSNTSVIVDSAKHYMKAVGLYREAPLQTKIILLTRDGRGVFYSNLKRNFGRRRSLQSWRRHFSRALPLFSNQLPASAVMQVHYEDLCRDPASTLRVVCEFIGVDFESSMLDYSAHDHHIANGNDMRFIESSEIRCDERWRDQLDPVDENYFKRYAWELNQQLGYND